MGAWWCELHAPSKDNLFLFSINWHRTRLFVDCPTSKDDSCVHFGDRKHRAYWFYGFYAPIRICAANGTVPVCDELILCAARVLDCAHSPLGSRQRALFPCMLGLFSMHVWLGIGRYIFDNPSSAHASSIEPGRFPLSRECRCRNRSLSWYVRRTLHHGHHQPWAIYEQA